MQAKSNRPYPVTAFTGREYVRYEWRDVPVGGEDEARRLADNGTLELQEAERPKVKPETAETPTVEGPVLAVDLESMTVTDLQELARERDVPYSGLRKAELIDALRDD